MPCRGGGFPRARSATGGATVLAVLHEPRFVDLAPAEVYATLLDEGRYLCSERTMYRILAAQQEVRERRESAPASRLPPRAAGRRPNQLWSWDITKLLGPAKWTYFYLYVMLDVFSRYVVGWMVAHGRARNWPSSSSRRRRTPGHRPRATHDPRRPRPGHDFQARRLSAGRPGRHQDPQPASRLQRQPVLGGAVQDAEVPAGIPGPLRLDPGCPGPLPHLLPLVQRRPSSQRPRPAHPARRALRLGRAARDGAGDRARHCLCRPPGTIPAGLPRPPARPEAVWINPPKPPAAEETRGLAATRGGVLDHARPGQLLSAHRSDLDRRGCLEVPA